MAERTPPLNDQQTRVVLQTIARRAEIARQLLWSSVDSAGEVLVTAAEAAATIMTSIGAMAEGASGEDVIGDADCWNYGPGFARIRGEVQHG